MALIFDEFTLDPSRRLLTRTGETVLVEPQVFDLIQLLAENSDRVVTRDEIIDVVWQGRIVSEGAISARIAAARRALGDDGKRQAVIRTVVRRGLQMVADVTQGAAAQDTQSYGQGAADSAAYGAASESETPSRAQTTRERPSIAVLPFDNMSSDPDQDFLADGIVEDVITELSRFRDLFVMARNSSFSFKGTSKDVRQIAKELGVEYVVEGAVRRAGKRLRVTAQLIEAASGTHVWADRWDRTIEDLFELQDELTGAIVSAVQPELGAHERALTLGKPVESLSVWELCHRASDWQTRIDAEKFDECERLLRRALELEPDNIRALVHFSRLQVSRVFLGIGRNPEAELAECLTAGRRAVELDARNDEAQRALGIALVAAGRFDEALTTIERGLALNPNNSGLHYSRGFCWLRPPYEFPERTEADMAMAEKLSPRDPLKVHCYGLTAQAWLASGKPGYEDKALSAFERAAYEQNTIWPYVAAAAALNADRGNMKRANEFLSAVLSLNPKATLALLPNAFPNPWWRASWARIANAGDLLVELGLPRE